MNMSVITRHIIQCANECKRTVVNIVQAQST